jgi:CPA2 family monovalent cation:H+ antiporter-2
MEGNQIVVDLVLAVLAAFVGGLIAQRLRQPVILGYLVAGVVIGPFTPGPSADPHSIEILAQLGVAFLMFALGAEFSLSELRRLGRLATIGGPLQILLSMGLGPLAASLLGLTLTQGIFLGALLALSSTVVVLKVLMGRGELQSLHGRVSLGILIAQDLAVVPMVIVLPAVSVGSDHILLDLALAAGKVGIVLLGVYLVGARAVPWLLGHVALTRTRELFVLGVVGLALGAALATQLAGLSLAFGAFLAGLVVAESDYRTQGIAEVLPFRDLFASLFFVSVGMLINPSTLVAEIGFLIPLAALVVVGKVLITTVVVLALGSPGRVALRTGLGLAQVGEFSFVLAQIGVADGAIPPRIFDLTLSTALVTIIVTPTLVQAAPVFESILARLPLIGARFREEVESDPEVAGLRDHTIICGCGRVGKELAEELHRRSEAFVVVEYNPSIVQELRARGMHAVYGDAANPLVLEHAQVERARLLAFLVSDDTTAEIATRHARARNPTLDIVARVSRAEDVSRLQQAGANQLVQPEFEAGIEVIRYVLRRYEDRDGELLRDIADSRQAFYRQDVPS